MGFADELRRQRIFNPNAMSSFGSPSSMTQDPTSEIMSIAQQYSNASPRMQQVFNPPMNTATSNPDVTKPMDVVFNPSGVSQLDKIRKDEMEDKEFNLRREVLGRSNRLEDERFILDKRRANREDDRLDLDSLKNKQINENATVKAEQRASEADRRLENAERALRGRENDAVARDQLARFKEAADEARYQLNLTRKDRDAEETARMNNARIAELESRLYEVTQSDVSEFDEAGNPTRRTTTTRRGQTSPNAPQAPTGWRYVRNSTNTGWTAVEDK